MKETENFNIDNLPSKNQIQEILDRLYDIIKDADKDSKWWIRELLIELDPDLNDRF